MSHFKETDLGAFWGPGGPKLIFESHFSWFWKLGGRFSVNSGKVNCETGKVSRKTGKVSRETGKVSRETGQVSCETYTSAAILLAG